MLMQRYEVGKLFDPKKTRYPEGVAFDFSNDGATLLIVFNSPLVREIEAIRDGKFQITLTEYRGILFILTKFGDLQWMDSPYHVHLSRPFVFAKLTEGMGYGLTIFLVDGATGILQVLRYIGLGHEFSHSFKSSVEKQRSDPFDHEKYRRNLDVVYRSHSTKDLLRMASVKYSSEKN